MNIFNLNFLLQWTSIFIVQILLLSVAFILIRKEIKKNIKKHDTIIETSSGKSFQFKYSHLRVDKEIKRLEILGNQSEPIHTFKSPKEMSYRSDKRLKEPKRSLVKYWFEIFPRKTEYDGVSVITTPYYNDVPKPSIDTIFLAKCSSKHIENSYSSIAEVGVGSGLAIKYLVTKHDNLKNISLIDINPDALYCALDNFKDFLLKNEYVIKAIKTDCLNGINSLFDVIISNPPYIPTYKKQDPTPNWYEGIRVLTNIISENRLRDNGVYIINYSHIAEKEFRKKIKELRLNIVESYKMKNIPFKVKNVITNKKWIEYLMELGLKKEGDEYFHDLIINIVMPNNMFNADLNRRVVN